MAAATTTTTTTTPVNASHDDGHPSIGLLASKNDGQQAQHQRVFETRWCVFYPLPSPSPPPTSRCVFHSSATTNASTYHHYESTTTTTY
jgi:hypothetical protein